MAGENNFEEMAWKVSISAPIIAYRATIITFFTINNKLVLAEDNLDWNLSKWMNCF